MRFWASEVASATGGRLVGPDVLIDGVSFDSRSVRRGQLFVPIVAGRDGHDFVGGAVGSGAVAFLSSRPIDGDAAGATGIEVGDTLTALMDLARARRRHFHGPVIGITGSVGKTSTKDMAAAAIGAGSRTWANERSFNNDQGLPTTLLNAPDGTEVLVLEMGMRGFGEIERLCRIAEPVVGVVTNVGEAHGDRVGGRDGVAQAKAELVRALPAGGLAILNGDDDRVRAMAGETTASVLLFGTTPGCDVRVSRVQLDDLGRAAFRVDTPWGASDVRLAVTGGHMALNAAAALACVGAVGGDLAAAAGALAAVQLTAMRMHLERTVRGALVLDDSYNANPTSMRAALDALAALPARRRIAVLGVMAEIVDAGREHRAIAEYANERAITVVAVGTDLYGVDPVDDAVAAVGDLGDGDAVLVKGSRVAALDAVAAALRGGSAAAWG